MVDMAVTEQRVQHEVALNNTTTSFHYIKHKRNDELQLIITVVCATGSLPLTPFIQLSAKKAFKASSPLHRNQGERAYKVIQIRRPRKLQQICGRGQEYKERVIFLTHTYCTHKYFLYNFCTLGCSILSERDTKLSGYTLYSSPHHPKNNYSCSNMTVSHIPLRTTAKYRPLSSD
jgi:hypothetical protein